jgi:hypothetical protein
MLDLSEIKGVDSEYLWRMKRIQELIGAISRGPCMFSAIAGKGAFHESVIPWAEELVRRLRELEESSVSAVKPED